MEFKKWMVNEGFFNAIKGAVQGFKQGWSSQNQPQQNQTPTQQAQPKEPQDPIGNLFATLGEKPHLAETILERIIYTLFPNPSDRQADTTLQQKWQRQLTQSLGKIGWRIMTVDNYQDVQVGWISVTDDSRGVNGNIVKWYRPIIIDHANQLKVQGIARIS